MNKNNNTGYTVEDLRRENLIILEYISGSHMYGTNLPESDMDIKGIFVLPDKAFSSYNFDPSYEDVTGEKFTSPNGKQCEETFFELRKFLQMLQKNNPNTLEVFDIPQDCLIYKHPIMDEILKMKNEFITKKAFFSFSGYALEQTAKAKGKNKKQNWEKERFERKTILDFCYIPYKQGSISIKQWISKKINITINIDSESIDQSQFGLVKIPHMTHTYGIYVGNGCKGMVNETETSTSLRVSEVPKEAMPIETMTFNESAWMIHCEEYKSYQTWLKEKNEARFIDVKNHNQQIDCYIEDETDFLTLSGWKKYDEIKDNELLATINNKHELIYQSINERFKLPYIGKIYSFENRYTKFSVTPNHKLYLCDANRNKTHKTIKNTSSTIFEEKRHTNWYMQTVSNYFEDKKSFKFFLNTLNNYNEEYLISDDEIKILGLFLSEGSFLFDIKNNIIGIIISQIKNDIINILSNDIKKFKIDHNKFFRKGRYEHTFSIRDRQFASFLYKNCGGRYCYEKIIPDFCFDFSLRQSKLLVEFMIKGDGTIYKKGHSVYYTSSFKMAEGLQLLLFKNGILTQFYSYHKKKGDSFGNRQMYRIFISKKTKKAFCINKNTKRPESGWKIKNVSEKSIVCFDIDSSILITRNNNKIAIQGNSKNMLHMQRLVNMAMDIASGKGIVSRRPEAKELIDIRKGNLSLQELLDSCKSKLEDLKVMFNNSSLPDNVDENICNEINETIRAKFKPYSMDLVTTAHLPSFK